MSNPNINEDLKNYLIQNEKPTISNQIKSSFSNLKLSNWMGNAYSRVPTEENASNGGISTSRSWFSSTPQQESDCCPRIGRIERIIGFCFCLFMGIVCFSLSAFYAPLLLLKARKFAMLFTLGSLFIIFSFSFLWGPKSHFQHLFSKDRMVFTCCYFITLLATLYFSLSVQSTPLTVLSAVAQIIALVWFLFSYIPGGSTECRLFTRLFSSYATSTVSRTLPV